jgi:NAD(P)-dependent dehydrogenase (short-subunit alcohol dehydrogenase family)
MADARAALITGCSTGIGRATAELLATRNWTVYATARRPESIKDLADAGCRTLALDVCDEESMRAAVEAVEREHGAVGALINNAGYAVEKAVETVPMSEIRKQFETNVFGLIRMCQLVLPAMRNARFGRIVNISSVGGKLTFPGGSYYHATKHAVEAFSDGLRFEVAPFGIDVIVVEPGLIKTAFADNTTSSDDDTDGVYADFNRAVAETVKQSYEGIRARMGGAVGPEAVADAIAGAIEARRPRTRYRITSGARVMLTTRKLLPDRLWDVVMSTQFPRPQPPKSDH